MTFRVDVDDEEVEIHDPRRHPVLREFVQGYAEVRSKGRPVEYHRNEVGRIHLRTTWDPPPAIDDVGRAAGFGDGVRHCCLMRSPGLVVEYRPGPKLSDEKVWYTGVFQAVDAYDDTFANAEPPTHDAWQPDQLEGRARGIVRTAIRKIDEALDAQARPQVFDGGSAENAGGLAGFSRRLGALLAPVAGKGAAPAAGGSGGPSRRSRVKMDGDPTWTSHDGRPVLAQRFTVDAGGSLTVQADCTVRVWGSSSGETQGPAGAKGPELIGWRAPDGTVQPPGRLALRSIDGGHWAALVSSPEDTVTRIRVREATAEEDGG
jgi:hypothetical protein